VLPAVYEPLDAIKKEAPEIHEGFERNINVTRHIEWGDVEAAFDEAEYIREDWFKCGGQAHMCMETRAAVSSYTPDGKLTVYHSRNLPSCRRSLRRWFERGEHTCHLPLRRAVSGASSGAAIFAVPLSMKLCRPVKIVFTRRRI
jgi:4-hydroxybenzoyl-CoA reductase subunit alpha